MRENIYKVCFGIGGTFVATSEKEAIRLAKKHFKENISKDDASSFIEDFQREELIPEVEQLTEKEIEEHGFMRLKNGKLKYKTKGMKRRQSNDNNNL